MDLPKIRTYSPEERKEKMEKYLAYFCLLQEMDSPEEPPQCDPKFVGPLAVDKLPMDAWEKWCKEGVLCFAVGSDDVLKVYFADPRNLSVYHVIDFDYLKFRRMSSVNSVGCILSASKIYIIGGQHAGRRGPVDVYFCDVSTPPELRDGSYEWNWQQGQSLNSYKGRPLVFSLVGNIYVLSVEDEVPFEVLKSDGRWEVLPPPPSPLSIHNQSVNISGKKIIFYADCRDSNSLMMYDAEHNEWTVMKLSLENPFSNVPTKYCLHVQENGVLLSSQEGTFLVLNFGSQPFQAFSSDPPSFKNNSLLDNGPNPTQWHLFQLRGRKFCFLALYTDFDNRKTYARVGTFDLVEHGSDARIGTAGSSDDPNSKRLKLTSYEVTSLKTKNIDLMSDFVLLPYRYCSKTGAFSLC